MSKNITLDEILLSDKLYFISDTHFGHSNILSFERNEFSSIEEHDKHLISAWNSVIGNREQIVIHLGDVGFVGSKDSEQTKHLKQCITKLNGFKVLIRGNHDTKGYKYYREIGFDLVLDGPLFIRKGKILLAHHPEPVQRQTHLMVHGHLHGAKLKDVEGITDKHFCVSAKYVDYKPISIKTFLRKGINQLPQRHEEFLDEWYAKYYDFTNTKNKEYIAYTDEGFIDVEKSKINKEVHDEEIQTSSK